jgi:hypothetical protein
MQRLSPPPPKVYVIGADNVLVEERGTLTARRLERLAAAAGGGGHLLQLPDRASSQPLERQPGAVQHPPRQQEQKATQRPPGWALRRLAAHLGAATGLTLFNFDVIVPEDQQQHAHHHHRNQQVEQGRPAPCAEEVAAATANDGAAAPAPAPDGPPGELHLPAVDPPAPDGPPGELQLQVVDVNFFPGFDKVAGAQRLLGARLRQVVLEAAAAAGLVVVPS